MRVAAALLLLMMAGCSTPPAAVSDTNAPPPPPPDPLSPGPMAWSRIHYDFGQYIVDDPTLVPYQYPVPINGSVTFPTAEGVYPVVLLMHGRHSTCAVAGAELIFTGVCPSAVVVEPVNSYRGYDGLAENLASHGYAVVSVNANTINDRDLLGDAGANARAELILRTLDDFASVNATGTPLPDSTMLPLPRTDVSVLRGNLDLTRVGLMGHSRGGEGVGRAISLDLERGGTHGLDAVFALAPTDFSRWQVAGPAFATLLPYCDGDVSNLQGAWMYDDARGKPGGPRYQILAMGANHNFYNTVWTGDDWGTTGEWCGSEESGSGRDSPEEQRAHGYGLMASFFRLFVGGESEFAAYWDEGKAWPRSMCPEHGSCFLRLLLSREMPAAFVVSQDGGGGDRLGDVTSEACAEATCPGTVYSVAPSHLLSWNGDATYSWPVKAPSGLHHISARIGVPTDGDRVSVMLRGMANVEGREVPVTGIYNIAQPAFALPPGGDNAKTVLNMVEVELAMDGETGIRYDSADLIRVEVELSGTGRVLLADVLLQP